MAEAADIARLRRLVGEPEDSTAWPDAVLAAIIDDAPDLNSAALEVWEAKAAAAASLVDTSESGSSRKMSQLHEQALKMVEYYKGVADPITQPPDLTGYAYVMPIERV